MRSNIWPKVALSVAKLPKYLRCYLHENECRCKDGNIRFRTGRGNTAISTHERQKWSKTTRNVSQSIKYCFVLVNLGGQIKRWWLNYERQLTHNFCAYAITIRPKSTKVLQNRYVLHENGRLYKRR